MGFELGSFTSRHSTSPISCDGFFEIQSRELFAWADFKPRSSLVAGITGVSHQHQADKNYY
jgi:hypothetical protein